MLVGVEFGVEELPRDETRNAIRAMSEETRAEALAWVVSYLEQQDANDPGSDAGRGPDQLWEERVAPWLKRVWPPEAVMRASATSEQFALAAIATDEAFDDAVATVRPYLTPSNAFYVLWKLDDSDHPDVHAQASLQLIDAAVAPDAPRFGDDHVRNILHRIGVVGEGIRDNHVYRRWHELVERHARGA